MLAHTVTVPSGQGAAGIGPEGIGAEGIAGGQVADDGGGAEGGGGAGGGDAARGVAVGAPVAVNASTESAASPDLQSKIILFLVDIFGQAASFGSQCVSAMNGRLCR